MTATIQRADKACKVGKRLSARWLRARVKPLSAWRRLFYCVRA